MSNYEERAALYYAVLRRFPPKDKLTGKDLDHYCHTVLQNEEFNRRICKYLDKMCSSTSPETYGFGYDQMEMQE
jgi:hypothetical protein